MPELEQKTFQKRLVAYKVKISDILKGDFLKDDLSAGYIKLNEVSVSRVNIVATIVYKFESLGLDSVVIDDGTGRITLRSFENSDLFKKVDVGDVVLVIGKIRVFSNEKYIMPEILKKINDIQWVNVRKLELRMDIKNNNISQDKVLADEMTTDIEKVYSVIKELDNGDGVSVENIIKSFGNIEVEIIINKLLASGDVFEINPGRLKVLE